MFRLTAFFCTWRTITAPHKEELWTKFIVKIVLLHEVAGHLGLRKLFSGDFDRFLFSIANEHSDEVAKIAADRNLDISNEAGLLEAAEEFVATFAENGTENTIWQRIAAAFRNFLRNLGFDLAFSDAELRSLLARGLRNLQGSVVKDNLTTDGDGVRYLAEPFTEAQKRELLSKAKASGLKSSPVLHKIIYGGSVTRNGNTVNFNGKNSHQIKKHLVGEGLSPVEGFIGFDDIEFILPKALETQWEPDRKKNKKGRKKGSSSVCDRNSQKKRKNRNTKLKKTGIAPIV